MSTEASSARRPLIWYMTQAYAVRGGHEAHILHFATELRAHGFDTRVIVLDKPPRSEHLFMRLLRERGIPLTGFRDPEGPILQRVVRLLAAPWAAWLRLRGRPADRTLLRNYLADRIAARRLRRCLARERPDIIHILGRLADYAWPELPAEGCVLHHGTEGRRDATWDGYEFDLFRDFARRAARNFAPGQGVVENIRREFGIARPIDSIYTICPDLAPDGVTAFSPPRDASRPPRFGVLCRMTPEKGIASLLDALVRYQADHGPVAFVFAGDGELAETIRREIVARELTSVSITTTFESPVAVLSELDVFVHPSLSDAMPLAIAEALMCGLPCVVTSVGGIPDLVRDRLEGIVIPPGDADAIAQAMWRFASMAVGERVEYSRRARQRYEAVCRPDRVGNEVAKHYRDILSATNPIGVKKS